MSSSMIILTAIILLLGYVVSTYNYCISLIEAIKNDSKQIDIQLDRRFKVFESLIEVVKKYMDYEKSTLKEVVKLRNESLSARSAGDDAKRMQNENAISGIMSGIKAVFEQYPDLKANALTSDLMKRVVTLENEISARRAGFNATVERYLARTHTFPDLLIAKLFKFESAELLSWDNSIRSVDHLDFTPNERSEEELGIEIINEEPDEDVDSDSETDSDTDVPKKEDE